MWLLYSIIAGSFYTASNLLTRHVLKQQKDAWAFSFFFSAFGALVSFPFLLAHFQVSPSLNPWLILLFVGVLIVANNWLNFRSSNYLETSVNGAILKFHLVWIYLLGILLLGEVSSWSKIIGTLITVSAGLVLTLKRIQNRQSFRGIVFAFASTFFYTVVIYFYKFLFNSFSSQSLTFFIFFIPMVINLIIMPQSLQRITGLIKNDLLPVALACSLGGFANLAMNHALSLGEASRVLVFMEAFLILTLVGEHFWLKETQQFRLKLAVVLAAIIGAILIQI